VEGEDGSGAVLAVAHEDDAVLAEQVVGDLDP